MSLVVVVGGRKSGKSSLAAILANDTVAPVTYVACAEVQTEEFADRVARHRADRPAAWTTIETFDLLAVLHDTPGTVIVDALDTWLLRRMEDLELWTDEAVDPKIEEMLLAEASAVAHAASERAPLTVLVAGTVGDGIHPMGAANRRFLDLHGLALQSFAGLAEQVLLTVAGRALPLARLDELD